MAEQADVPGPARMCTPASTVPELLPNWRLPPMKRHGHGSGLVLQARRLQPFAAGGGVRRWRVVGRGRTLAAVVQLPHPLAGAAPPAVALAGPLSFNDVGWYGGRRTILSNERGVVKRPGASVQGLLTLACRAGCLVALQTAA